ncbi:MAG: TetR/AcrR family transcriptional regulator [Planctomycetota bacterium]|jgi:AcrR family transcriptional regulator
MRVTQQTKEETRARILEAARQLFRTQGFDATRTKEIASEAGIATGTLFNYFPTKEAVALSLIDSALQAAEKTFTKRASESESLEEDLFSYIATGLRKLRPYRVYAQTVIETCLSPATADGVNSDADTVRSRHLEVFGELAAARGFTEPATAMECQLYWTLYTGVLSFWSSDSSPHQEDTLALLDQSLRMFVSWFCQQRDSQADHE